MKSIISILSIALISLGAVAQNNAVDKYFTDYQEDINFTKVNVSGKMFDLAQFLETEDAEVEEFKDLASGVENLKALFGQEIKDGFSAYDNAIYKVQNDFEELMAVDDKDGKVTFFINEKDGIVNEFLAIGAGDSALVIVSIIGKIDLKKLGAVTKKIQSENFDFISKMDENGGADINVYPNPVNAGNEVNITIPQELEKAKITLYNSNGSKVRKLNNQSGKAVLNTESLPSGTYILEFQRGSATIKKKIVVQ